MNHLGTSSLPAATSATAAAGSSSSSSSFSSSSPLLALEKTAKGLFTLGHEDFLDLSNLGSQLDVKGSFRM